jgi:hypothetical protein
MPRRCGEVGEQAAQGQGSTGDFVRLAYVDVMSRRLWAALDTWARHPLTLGQIEQLAAAGTDAGGVDALNRFYDWRRGSIAGLSKGLAAIAGSVFAGFLAELVKALPKDARPASAGVDAAAVGIATGFAAVALAAFAATAELEDRYVLDYRALTYLQQYYKKATP